MSNNEEKARDLAKLSLEDLEAKFETSSKGLTQEEAQKRLEEYGYNEIAEKQKNPLLKFMAFFWGPIPWMIEVAVILSAILSDWEDFSVILLLLLVNAVVGFWEEHQAGNAIAALKAKLALSAKALRDGKWSDIPSREVVPGDVVRLHIGDIVPADVMLMGGDPLEIDQSSLTGESLPVVRGPSDTVYSGSIIKQGEIDGVAYATGQKTFFGEAAKLVSETEASGHFQKILLKIGDFLIIIALVLMVLVLVMGFFRHDDMLQTLRFALVMAIASIPVAMPTVLSVTMALGSRKLAKKNAIVSRLTAIEELAGMEILCSDKTGTLTQNKLTVGDAQLLKNYAKDDLFLAAALASRGENKDAIDEAILHAFGNDDLLKEYKVVHFKPFDPVSKRIEATIQDKDGQEFKVSKGAPQVISKLVDDESITAEVDKTVTDFAGRGFRSLGVGRTVAEDKWEYLGIIPLYDPPREDSAETIKVANTLGCKVKMVTGDQVAIAKETAEQLGMGTNILDASILDEGSISQRAMLTDSIEKADGFAQVFPEHKYNIVRDLQQAGHLVGMTGDGVNDAPALKKANAGIAVSGATDAAREAADIVLTTPGLSVIIDAIKESRRIFQRMNSYALYRIAETIQILLFMTVSILVFNFYPVTAIMIVLIAILNDGAILSIGYDNVIPSHKPDKWQMPLLLGLSFVIGFVALISSFMLFYFAEHVFGHSRDVIQTFMYLQLSIGGHLTIFATRTRGRFWSSKPAPILIYAVFGTQLVATLLGVYGIFMQPIGWSWALFVWGYSIIWLVIMDNVKLFAYRIFTPKITPLMAERKHIRI